jgi:fermentation-respiration switch protein FrsA (DUF1100 family)
MTITFKADDGTELHGVLRAASPGAPAVALTGPFTGVKDQVTGTYAERLFDAGLTTLAFDHRGWGQSGGRRCHEDTQGKLADLRAAVSVLTEHSDGIGVVGICLGGGYAVRTAAADPRVAAVAGIAGAYNSPAWFVGRMGTGTYRAALASFIERYDEYLPAVAPDNGEAAMAGDEPYSYYGTMRGASAHWRNEVTRGSLHSLMTFDALAAADLLTATPLLVVHGTKDDYCSPDLARMLHERAQGPKEIAWLDTTNHIDLYDTEPFVTQAADLTAAFLKKFLSP